MNHQRDIWSTILAISFMCAIDFARAQEPTSHPIGRNVPQNKFGAFPGLPTCAEGAVQSGDPSKGPSIILARNAAGCSIPWHWHTPNEHLMMVSGTARVEAKDEKPMTLRAGGFARLPSRHVHQFRCTTACLFYVYSDAAFDIHYVDRQGSEMTPDDALKAVKEKAAKPMQ